jgi:hypothetical protein
MLMEIGFDKLGCANVDAVTLDRNPVIGNLCNSFKIFYDAFLKVNATGKSQVY